LLYLREFVMTKITIELPDDVAQSAQRAGLLSGQTLASIVRELVRDRAARKLQQVILNFDDHPVSADELTASDIQHAIDATRSH
jgi:Arc/MetJ family transcription regulator